MKLSKLLVVLAVMPLSGVGFSSAAVIKSVQSGAATFASGQNTLPVALAALDPSKTIVWGGINWGGGRSANPFPRATRAGYELSNPTTLNLQRLGAASESTVVEWQAIEFVSGVAIQRGKASFLSTDLIINVPVSTVNISQTLVLISVATGASGQNADEEWTVMARLTSGTNIELSRNQSGSVIDVYWQVWEMSGAPVQGGPLTIPAGDSSATAVISSVDLSKSFLLLTQKASAAVNGVESEYTVRGQIASPTQLNFDRISTNNSVDLAWQVISLADGSSVQAGITTVNSLDLSATAIINPVVVARTASFVSVRGSIGNSNADLDEVSFTHTLSTPTSLTVTRAKTGSGVQLAWSTIQFNNLSVTVSDSLFSFGAVPLNTWLPPDSSVMTNDGPASENFIGKISAFASGLNNWALSPTNNGADLIRAQWSTSGASGPWNNISAYDTDFTIATSVPVNGSVPFWFQIQTPTVTSSFNSYSSILTVTAR